MKEHYCILYYPYEEGMALELLKLEITPTNIQQSNFDYTANRIVLGIYDYTIDFFLRDKTERISDFLSQSAQDGLLKENLEECKLKRVNSEGERKEGLDAVVMDIVREELKVKE
jgi:hypothetical protein